MSTALAGGLLTTGPPGKSCRCVLDVFVGRGELMSCYSGILIPMSSLVFFVQFLKVGG